MVTYERPTLRHAGSFKKDTGAKGTGRGDWLFSSKILSGGKTPRES